MRRSAWWTIMVCFGLVACGGDNAPALFTPDSDAGDLDASSGSGGDSGAAGQDGGVGDVCIDHLDGISCQVEEISLGWGYLVARFSDGTVKVLASSGVALPDLAPFVDLDAPAVALDKDCVLLSNHKVSCWDRTAGSLVSPLPPSAAAIERVQAGLDYREPGRFVLLDTGVIQQWVRPHTTVYEERAIALAVPINDFSLGLADDGNFSTYQICAIAGNSQLYCWGLENTFGDLGYDDRMRHAPDLNLRPVMLGAGAEVIQVAKSASTTCVVLRDHRLKCWGNNNFGQLGLGDNVARGGSPGDMATLPFVAVPAVSQVVVTESWTCTVEVSGTLKCWGANFLGLLGTGDSLGRGGVDSVRTLPINLGTGRTALQVTTDTNDQRVCALLDDHSVKCWGNGVGNEPGEMGDALARVDFGSASLVGKKALAPQVTVTSPLPSLDPQTDTIHSGNALTVQCAATPSTTTRYPVDDGSVRVRVHSNSAIGAVVSEATAALTTSGTYTATLLGFASLPTGSYWVECIAADNQDPPAEGHATIQIIHDGGPTLEFIAPAEDQVVGQSSLLHIDVAIRAAPLGTVDPDAAVATESLTVAGVPVALVQSTTDPDRYTADVDFLSSEFQPAPVGNILISVTATNMRNASATLQQSVLVDGTGPLIAVQGTNHDNGALIRGAQAMFVTLTDTPAGVDASGAYGRIGSFTFPFTRLTGDTYRGVFDSLRFDRTVSQLTVEVHALDLVGNEAVLTRTLQLDNQPPLISLDPPMIREFKAGTPNTYQCSTPFDPVGSDSLSDGDIAPEGAELRARVEDRTNGLQGFGVLVYFALVDPTRVRVYLQDDLTAPILVDADGDGACDDINDEVTPQLRDLKPIQPTGVSYYPASAATDGLDPIWDGSFCDVGMATVSPVTLCASTSPLTRVIKGPVLGPPVPAIYGLSVVNPVACVGDAWDWRLQFPMGGPVCAVARAEDTLGNVGISRPIRLCLQRSDGIGFDCNANLAWQTHDCLSGNYGGSAVTCTPPPDFGLDYVREDNP